MANNQAVATMSENNAQAAKKKNPTIAMEVLERVERMRSAGQLRTPPDYDAANALNEAYLILKEKVDKNGQPVLKTCSRESISLALLDMVILGLNPARNQCYFIAYGNKLTLFESYHGKMAEARRADPEIADITARIVYQDEIPVIDTNGGYDVLISHKRNPFAQHKISEAIGAYCNIIWKDGHSKVTTMTMDEIRRCWQLGKANLKSPAHQLTPEEMMKRTVINRALRPIINSSSDAYLFRDQNMEMAKAYRDLDVKENTNVIDVDFDGDSRMEDELVESPKIVAAIENPAHQPDPGSAEYVEAEIVEEPQLHEDAYDEYMDYDADEVPFL